MTVLTLPWTAVLWITRLRRLLAFTDRAVLPSRSVQSSAIRTHPPGDSWSFLEALRANLHVECIGLSTFAVPRMRAVLFQFLFVSAAWTFWLSRREWVLTFSADYTSFMAFRSTYGALGLLATPTDSMRLIIFICAKFAYPSLIILKPFTALALYRSVIIPTLADPQTHFFQKFLRERLYLIKRSMIRQLTLLTLFAPHYI